jgi:hypothetical protein
MAVRYAGRGVALAGLLLVPFCHEVESSNPTNSGPTRQTQQRPLGLWTAAGATDISGKEPFSRRGVAGFGKERVIVPWAGRWNCLVAIFDAWLMLAFVSRNFCQLLMHNGIELLFHHQNDPTAAQRIHPFALGPVGGPSGFRIR